MDVAERQIDAFIERRSKRGSDEEQRAVEALWKDSARRHNEQRRRENGAAWYDFHMAMREVHSRLASEHERKAADLLGAGGDTT